MTARLVSGIHVFSHALPQPPQPHTLSHTATLPHTATYTFTLPMQCTKRYMARLGKQQHRHTRTQKET